MRLIKPSSGLRVVSAVAVLYFATLQARDLNIPDPSKLALLNNVAPGDVVVLKNGICKDARRFVRKGGSDKKALVIRAETPGGVIFSGNSSMKFNVPCDLHALDSTIAQEHATLNPALDSRKSKL